MQRTKATFRAMRDMAGLSQHELAEILGVSERSINRWEHPIKEYFPKYDDIWEVLEGAVKTQQEVADYAICLADDKKKQLGQDIPVQITYYYSQRQYDKYGREPGAVGIANANARAAAFALMQQGYEVEFRYPVSIEDYDENDA